MGRGRGIIPKEFYRRDPSIVARELVGAYLARSLPEGLIVCRVVEVEAYYGEEDPASRARRWGNIRLALYGDQGLTLIYGMHRQWLLNVVAHVDGEAGAVLVRGCEPLETPGNLRLEVEPRGPGLLTRALRIDKTLNRLPVYSGESPIRIYKGEARPPYVASSKRIGVTSDLDRDLRFYWPCNRYVSRAKRCRGT